MKTVKITVQVVGQDESYTYEKECSDEDATGLIKMAKTLGGYDEHDEDDPPTIKIWEQPDYDGVVAVDAYKPNVRHVAVAEAVQRARDHDD